MRYNDTIIARATPPGWGGIGVLRISGSKAKNVSETVLGKMLSPRHAYYLTFKDVDNSPLDHGIAIWFPSPDSFTGEDILELHGHGGPIVLDLVLKRILMLPGIRVANPGEFSERAFLNNKIDLTQAEAIADLINAGSEIEARCALNSLSGIFSSRIKLLEKELTNLRIYLEAIINFPNEEIDCDIGNKIQDQFEKVMVYLNSVLTEAKQGSLLREGMKVVIVGYPNAGKSSLINALAGRKVAIVTNIEGTTRDVLNEHIQIDGMPLHIIDTAGLRKTHDVVERIAISCTWEAIQQADHILFVVDSSIITKDIDLLKINSDIFMRFPENIPITIIRNKADITGEVIQINNVNGRVFISLSALTGNGINILRNHLKKSMGFNDIIRENNYLVRHRHLKALNTVQHHLKKCKKYLSIPQCNEELICEELRLAQLSLNEITGEFTSDDLLSKIFSSFCIGK